MPEIECLQKANSVLSFFSGLLVNEAVHVWREHRKKRSQRKTTIAIALSEIVAQHELASQIRGEYKSALDEVRNGEPATRQLKKSGLYSASLKAVKVQLIEVSAEEDLVIAINKAANCIDAVEAIRESAILTLEKVIDSYSLDHHEYPRLRSSIHQLLNLQDALQNAMNALAEASGIFADAK